MRASTGFNSRLMGCAESHLPRESALFRIDSQDFGVQVPAVVAVVSCARYSCRALHTKTLRIARSHKRMRFDFTWLLLFCAVSDLLNHAVHPYLLGGW